MSILTHEGVSDEPRADHDDDDRGLEVVESGDVVLEIEVQPLPVKMTPMMGLWKGVTISNNLLLTVTVYYFFMKHEFGI